ncbi:MAG: hypothetical protein K6T80_01950 [Firmicutes bacterium]|nr:hypothetical protein [Bacillota bacterium]
MKKQIFESGGRIAVLAGKRKTGELIAYLAGQRLKRALENSSGRGAGEAKESGKGD